MVLPVGIDVTSAGRRRLCVACRAGVAAVAGGDWASNRTAAKPEHAHSRSDTTHWNIRMVGIRRPTRYRDERRNRPQRSPVVEPLRRPANSARSMLSAIAL